MPGMDGWTLAEQIRNEPSLEDCRIVLLYPASQPTSPSRARQSGIEHCLTKPAKASALVDTMCDALGIPRGREEPDEPSPAPSYGALRILLAEDGPINQEVAVGLLELKGHEVEVADNGKEALEALRRQTFDLVLMDVEMPEMDGLEATRAIRAQEETTGEHVPIVAMTAHALTGFRERCIEAGMDGYISKPIGSEELDRVLGSITAPGDREAPHGEARSTPS
jgi:two-component system sensor kinase